MEVKVKFSLCNYCLGFWWGKGDQVNSDAKHVFAIVLPMSAILFLWGCRNPVAITEKAAVRRMRKCELTDSQKRKLWKGKCPDCGGDLLEGPHGGMSVNVKCEKCDSRFNVCMVKGTFAERI